MTVSPVGPEHLLLLLLYIIIIIIIIITVYRPI